MQTCNHNHTTFKNAPAQRAGCATRILLQHGFKAKNIAGGTLSRAMRGLAELK